MNLLNNKILGTIFLAFFFLSGFQTAKAATRTWDGGGADNNWSTAAN